MFLSDDDVNSTSSTVPEEERLKMRLDQEWVNALMERERLKREGEMERMEKERLKRELEMVRLEQEKVRRENEQRLIQEKIMEFERLRLANDLEKDRMIREQERLQDEKEQELRRREKQEKQLREDEVLRLEKLLREEEIARLEKEAKIWEMQRQMTVVNPIQRNNLLVGDIRHESLERGSGVGEEIGEVTHPVESKGCHDDVVEEQQRILEMILKEKEQEELNQRLIRSLCSPDQSVPSRSPVQPQPILPENAWLPCKMQKEPNCWEKVHKRRKQLKFQNQATTERGGKKIGEEALLASKKKESEEQLRRRSRSNTNQKVILVPNLTEETLGPNNWEAGQECLTDAPKLSLAMQRRRVDIIS